MLPLGDTHRAVYDLQFAVISGYRLFYGDVENSKVPSRCSTCKTVMTAYEKAILPRLRFLSPSGLFVAL